MRIRLGVVPTSFAVVLMALLAGVAFGQGTPGKPQIPFKKFKKGGRPGEIITPAAKGERKTDSLRVGDPAPDFALPIVKGAGEIRLSDFRSKKPVVLIFASYT